ncbi:hypothetical protein [Siminovitchia sp. 179-K 8D1 HS]|uniref:hypothetical protein n=1 Tax=Siminovitchia sp. 179-K 8D1 HS TaxID=3142385 RepID=UPI0039A0DC3F
MESYIKDSLERRDQELLQAIRESQQARMEVAMTQEKETEQKSWFRRLLGK